MKAATYIVDRGDARAVENETALIKQAMEYDLDALGRIYDFYQSRIYRYIYSRIGDAHIAEDLTSEVFMKMLKALRSRKGPSNSVVAWLYGIAHHLVVDYYRAHKRASQPLPEELMESQEATLSILEKKLLKDQVREAMADLTENQQKVLILKFVEGMSNLEVARILGKSEGAVKSIQYRALASLARLMRLQNA